MNSPSGTSVAASEIWRRDARPLGAKFDPNLHEALFEVPDETFPNGTVAQVMEDGYTIGERVLRPAKVGVSRGGPKAGS